MTASFLRLQIAEFSFALEFLAEKSFAVSGKIISSDISRQRIVGAFFIPENAHAYQRLPSLKS